MLHLTLRELSTLEFILKGSTHPRAEELHSLVTDAYEHEKEAIRQKYLRQFAE